MDRVSAGSGLVLLAVALALTILPNEARASAWNEPRGRGLVVVDSTFTNGRRYFNGEGQLAPAAAYRKQEAFGYLEYGVTDWLMAVLKPDVVATSIASSSRGTAKYAGLGTSEAGAQVQLWAFGPAVFAAQGSFSLPGTSDPNRVAMAGNMSREGEARALMGVAFALGSWPAFLDAQAAYRMRSGLALDEWHADVTVGARPIPRLLVMVQSFSTITQGAGTPSCPTSRYSKLGFRAVYDLNRSWSVDAGLFQTVQGWNALQERSVLSGLWYRF